MVGIDASIKAWLTSTPVSCGIRPVSWLARAGLHTGECEVVGDKLAGVAVHIGARIAATAEAGEILVSSTVRDLVAGSGLRFVSRGPRTLKGLQEERELHAVDERV